MTSKILTIAKKDFIDAVRSKLLWGAILVLFVVVLPDYLSSLENKLVARDGIKFIPVVLVNYVGPLAMISAHRAVVGERETGSLRVMLGLPATRRDFVLGKVLGRATLVSAILLVVVSGIGIAAYAHYGTLPVVPFLAIAGYIAMYGITWTGITVGVSSAVSTRLRAITIVLGLFLFFGPFQIWDRLAVPLFAKVITGTSELVGIIPLKVSTWPMWYHLVQRLNPMQNFTLGRYYFIRLVDPSVPLSDQHTAHLFGFAVLLMWFIVPLAVGLFQFERADLG